MGITAWSAMLHLHFKKQAITIAYRDASYLYRFIYHNVLDKKLIN